VQAGKPIVIGTTGLQGAEESAVREAARQVKNNPDLQLTKVIAMSGKVSEDEIRSYCREQLAEYKVPHIVEFRGELPKTDVGKVSRRELREEGAG